MEWNIWAISPLPVCSRLADKIPQQLVLWQAAGAGKGQAARQVAMLPGSTRTLLPAWSASPTPATGGGASGYLTPSPFPTL